MLPYMPRGPVSDAMLAFYAVLALVALVMLVWALYTDWRG